MITTDIHGAPKLPRGYEYFVHIEHSPLSDPAGTVKPPRPQAEVTVSIVEDVFGYMDIHSQYTEVTRSHLMGAVVAAATHAYEEWEDRPHEQNVSALHG